jgi:hypothetical protein
MNDSSPPAPHFLRVVRALARVRDAAIPVAAVTTVFAGVACGAQDGVVAMGIVAMDGGNGGATTTSTTHTGTTSSSTSTSLGSGGFMVMPDGGETADGGDGGH